jgi:glycosyltransferase involved in cell wall biosynthesis
VYPEQTYVIAGRPTFGYDPGFDVIGCPDLVKVIKRHLSNEELVEIISDSKLVVCPYIEASQSGIVMTAYALDTPVLVTDIGGLPEYVDDKLTGLICEEISGTGISKQIIEFLSTNIGETLKQNIKEGTIFTDTRNENVLLFKQLYRA